MNQSCLVNDCNKVVVKKGFCRMHYTRDYRHGSPHIKLKNQGELPDFLENVILKHEGDDCLIWPFVRSGTGYGQMRHNGKLRIVSRIVCERTNGPPPDETYEAAHSCGKGTLGCVSKRHLSWKTPKENNADKIIHGTTNRGERQWNSKLTEADVLEILSLKGKEQQSVIASRFGTTPQAISKIHTGRTWAWVQQGIQRVHGARP